MECVFNQLESVVNDLPEFPVDSRRVFHGRGHSYPDLEFLSIDLFDPVLVVTFFTPPPVKWEEPFIVQFKKITKSTRIEAIQLQRRYLKGAPSETIYGTLPDEIFAHRGNQRFQLKLGTRQNVGFFLDMEPGRAWLEKQCEGKSVLNLFAYTCTFSVVALGAGARSVFNNDMASGAINQGRKNHRLNNLDPRRATFFDGNVFKSWGRLKTQAPYDLLVIDPPSHQPGSFVAKKDYPKVIKRIPQLLRPGGEILASLNAPELGFEYFKEMFTEASPSCTFVERLSPSTDFPDIDPERQLKLLVFRYEPDESNHK
ncbi:class I SAM-dependent methyltransferase [Puniceicoccaceae bacterium K14]|nr:class I SAM-dependent methyltransferase [Puniceicoccaceae bacterium K14]